MGVLGWDVISGGETTLRGVITSTHHSGDDEDWIVSVKPGFGYTYLLTNQDGFTNGDGTIECEIDPPDQIFGEDPNDDSVVQKYIGGRANLAARVQGLWVRDLSHNVWGDEPSVLDYVPFPTGSWDTRLGKTEIHPISSLLVKHPAPNPNARRFEFFVFADEGGRPLGFPDPIGAKESRPGDFAIAIPTGAKMTVVSDGRTDMVSSATIGIEQRQSYSVLTGKFESGRPDAGKGFYHVIFDVPALFSVRAFLESPWDYKPGPCDHIAHELEQMKKGKEFDPELKKWLPAPVSEEELAAKQQQLQDCVAKSKALTKQMSLRATIGPPQGPTLSPQCQQISLDLAKMKKGEFDKDLKKWLPTATPEEIAAKEKELQDCISQHASTPAPPFSLRNLIEGSYP